MKSTKRRAAFARKSTKRQTSSSARPSTPLDGVVRVSVVATGIDQATITQIEPVAYQPRAEQAHHIRAAAPALAQVRAAPPSPAPVEAVQLRQAVVNDVELQPVAPVAVAFPEPIELRREHEDEATQFIPPVPEQPAARGPRMPQIEDLPPVAQSQLRAMRERERELAGRRSRVVARCWKNWRHLELLVTTRTRSRRRPTRSRRPPLNSVRNPLLWPIRNSVGLSRGRNLSERRRNLICLRGRYIVLQ